MTGTVSELLAQDGSKAEMCMPGDNIKMTVELLPDSPIAMDEGLRFAIREGGRTVGSGVVTKILAVATGLAAMQRNAGSIRAQLRVAAKRGQE